MSLRGRHDHAERSHLDGADPLPALTGAAPSPNRQLVFGYGKASALRSERFKIVRRTAIAPWELYDLVADAAESQDLAAARSVDVQRLASQYQAWLDCVQRDASPAAPRPPQEE